MPTTHFLSSNRELNKYDYYLDTRPFPKYLGPLCILTNF
jgi:hypothetical protein